MQAVRCHEYGSLDNLVLERVPDPVPGENEVVVDVRAAGLNFPDLLLVLGKYQARPKVPFVPGGECAGQVSVVGEGVQRLKIGDSVIAMGLTGAFAEKMATTESSTQPIPEGMSFDAAAGISVTYATSYYALKQRADLRPEETLLVLGAAGGVGIAAVELGHAMGARVIAAASSEEKLDTACEAGAELRINDTTENLKERVKELTRGRGADVVYDPVGGEYSEPALRAVAWNGRYLVIGFAAGDIPRLPLNLPLLKGCSVVGVFWGAWAQRDPRASSRNFVELKELFEDGRLRPRVTPFALADYRKAFDFMAERRARGKLVLVM